MRKSDLRKLLRLVRLLTGIDPVEILENEIRKIVKGLLLMGCDQVKRYARKARTHIRWYMLKRCS